MIVGSVGQITVSVTIVRVVTSMLVGGKVEGATSDDLDSDEVIVGTSDGLDSEEVTSGTSEDLVSEEEVVLGVGPTGGDEVETEKVVGIGTVVL